PASEARGSQKWHESWRKIFPSFCCGKGGGAPPPRNTIEDSSRNPFIRRGRGGECKGPRRDLRQDCTNNNNINYYYNSDYSYYYYSYSYYSYYYYYYCDCYS